MLTLMKGDKVVEGSKPFADFSLFSYIWYRYWHFKKHRVLN